MKEFRYLALGDSYTIGEAVEPALSFPHQLVASLEAEVQPSPVIIAKTGWTTGELIQAIEEQQPAGIFNLVTLLIGVNNQYRGYSIDKYQREFSSLLEQAIRFAGGNTDRVIVISIPDWGVTPFAGEDRRSRTEIAAEIDSFNMINREEAGRIGVRYVDITEGSRTAARDPELLAEDGLHPSGKMYREWVDLVLPLAQDLL